MAQSKCPNTNCQGISFEAKTVELEGYIYGVKLIQCSKCGTVVGVLPFHDTAHTVSELSSELFTEIEKLSDKLDYMKKPNNCGDLSG